MAGTMSQVIHPWQHGHAVSMESGLDGRNNLHPHIDRVSLLVVSMESGLDGRNNTTDTACYTGWHFGLNGVRPRWPEQ